MLDPTTRFNRSSELRHNIFDIVYIGEYLERQYCETARCLSENGLALRKSNKYVKDHKDGNEFTLLTLLKSDRRMPKLATFVV